MTMREVDWGYLESPVGIPLVHLEALDCHGEPQVFSAAYVCEPPVVLNPPDAYELSSENI